MAWIDLDEVILDRARESYHQEGRTPRDIYKALGPDVFRNLETAAVRYLKIYSNRPQIIATGGGVADNPAALKELSSIGLGIYLQENEAVLYERVIAGGLPPFLDADNPRTSFAQLYQRRDSIYRQTAQITIELQGANIAQALELFEKAIKKYISR